MASSAISAELALEIREFMAGIKKAQGSASKFSKQGKAQTTSWTAGVKKLAGSLANAGQAAAKAAAAAGAVGAAATVALAAGIKNAFDLGGKYSDLAAQMGTTAGKARVLGAAFEANGMSAEQVGTTINKMSKALNDAGNGLATSQRAFSELGLDPKALIKSDPVAAFHQITAALAEVGDESKRVALSMDIFGRSGGKLGVLLKDKEALNNAKDLIGGQADILDKHAASFDRASDVLAQTGTKVQGFFVGVGAQIVDQIMPAIEAISRLDLSGIGERFGAALSKALDYAVAVVRVLSKLDLSQWGELLRAGLHVAIGAAVNTLWKGFVAAGAAIGQLLHEHAKTFIALVGIVSKADFWKGLGNTFVGLAQLLTAAIMKGMAAAISTIKEATGPAGKIAFGNVDKGLAMGADVARDASRKNLSKAGTRLAPAFAAAAERLKETSKNVAGAFRDSFMSTDGIVDTSKSGAKLGAVKVDIQDAVRSIAELRRRATAPLSAAPAGPATASQSGGLAINSRLAGAINTIAGRNANAIIAAEAARTAEATEKGNELLKRIERKIGKTEKPMPRRVMVGAESGGGRFA